MEPIVARYQFTKAEAVKASMEVSRVVAPAIRWMPWFGCAMFVTSIGAVFLGMAALPDLGFPVLFSIILMLTPLLVRHAAGRQFQSMPLANKEMTWEIDANRLRNSSEASEATFEWRILFEVRETRDGFLLFVQRRLAHWLPKAAFKSTEDVSAFRTLVRSSGVRHKGLQP